MHTAFKKGQTLSRLLMEGAPRRETHERKATHAPSRALERAAIGIFSRLMPSKCHTPSAARKEEKCNVSIRIFKNLPGSLISPQYVTVVNSPVAC